MEEEYCVPGKSTAQELIYKQIGKRELALTFLPPVVKVYEKAPVYFIIAGGGWHTETRQSMIDFSKLSVEYLRRRGFAVVSPDYRVYREPGVVMRHIISDCFDAARYIAHFEDILEIDSERIVVSGHSAGGHLALMLAYAPQDQFREDSVLRDPFHVAAVIPFSPPTILYECPGVPKTLGFDVEEAFGKDDCLDERRYASPYDYAGPHCPPTVLFAGAEDPLVYSVSSLLLHEKLKENGVESLLVLSKGGGHQFEQMRPDVVPSPSKDEIQEIAARFAVQWVKPKLVLN